ncbi:rhodanese-like domain-containing protein [Helicobacter sp. 23-1048]
MKKFLSCVIVAVVFIACGEKEQGEANKALALHNDFVAQKQSEEVVALQQRANASGYKLITAPQLEEAQEAIIIATLPRGIYNLGLIEGAKHFEFAKSITFNDNGSEWNWDKDALSRDKSEFVEFLGEDKGAMIVFYDEGEDIFAPFGSAHTALIWARHLGYENLYRLVGGFGAWKGLGLPITTQMPECCVNPHAKDSHTSEHKY